MEKRVNQELQPEIKMVLRSLDIEVQYCYTINSSKNRPQSLSIGVECVGISLSDLSSLLPWASFIVCPVNDATLELYTSLPAEIEKCIIK